MSNVSPRPATTVMVRSIRPLLELGADGLYEDLVTLFGDEANPLELRAESLASIGFLEETARIPYIESVFADPHAPTRLRSAAALCPTWIQTCVFSWRGAPPSDAEQRAYLDCVRQLRSIVRMPLSH